jgi:hypothetical protein
MKKEDDRAVGWTGNAMEDLDAILERGEGSGCDGHDDWFLKALMVVLM